MTNRVIKQEVSACMMTILVRVEGNQRHNIEGGVHDVLS